MTFGFGDLFSAIGGAAGSFLSNASSSQMLGLSKEAQKELMNYQAKLNWNYYNKDLNINKYSISRKQLTAAGYNPYLMPGAQVSGANAWTSPQSVSDLGAGSNVPANFSSAAQMQSVQQQGELNDAQISNLGAQSEVANADALLKKAQTGLESQRALRQVLENANYPEEFKKRMENLVSQTTLNGIIGSTSQMNARSQAQIANATSKNAETQRRLLYGQLQYLSDNGYLSRNQAELIAKKIPYASSQELWDMYQKFGIGTGAILGGATGVGNLLNTLGLFDKNSPVGFR